MSTLEQTTSAVRAGFELDTVSLLQWLRAHVPEFADATTLELRQFRDNDPSRVVRHQLLVPAIDAVAGGIRVRQVDVAPASSPGSGASRPGTQRPCDLLLH